MNQMLNLTSDLLYLIFYSWLFTNLIGPYDVSNLGFLFGLNEHQGKQSVSQEALNLIKAAAGRKVGPYRATVQKVDKLSESERWKLPTAGEKETRAGSKREAVSDEDSEEEEEDGEEMEEAESSCEEDRNENDGFQDVMQ